MSVHETVQALGPLPAQAQPSVRDTVVAVFTEVARDQQRNLPPPADDTSLLDLGLDSLGMAVIVARLEGSLGIDPFSTAEDMAVPLTFGDFVALYEHAAT